MGSALILAARASVEIKLESNFKPPQMWFGSKSHFMQFFCRQELLKSIWIQCGHAEKTDLGWQSDKTFDKSRRGTVAVG